MTKSAESKSYCKDDVYIGVVCYVVICSAFFLEGKVSLRA